MNAYTALPTIVQRSAEREPFFFDKLGSMTESDWLDGIALIDRVLAAAKENGGIDPIAEVVLEELRREFVCERNFRNEFYGQEAMRADAV